MELHVSADSLGFSSRPTQTQLRPQEQLIRKLAEEQYINTYSYTVVSVDIRKSTPLAPHNFMTRHFPDCLSSLIPAPPGAGSRRHVLVFREVEAVLVFDRRIDMVSF